MSHVKQKMKYEYLFIYLLCYIFDYYCYDVYLVLTVLNTN